MELSIKELNKITKICPTSLYKYLGNYRFNKFLTKDRKRNNKFVINNEFISELSNYFDLLKNNVSGNIQQKLTLGITRLEIYIKTGKY